MRASSRSTCSGSGCCRASRSASTGSRELHGAPIDLSRIPLDDPAVFSEIQAADTVGVFQIESRAQMQSLLRTRPETIDDLTVQVALVRPGPIQGKAVHPYIEHRRRLREDPTFVHPVQHELLREPLASTLGVVVFQDQVLDVAIALAGFSIGEAEGLRRAMSRKRSLEALEAHRGRFVEGAAGKGVDELTANEVYDTLVGFSGFGFPKSHAAAFGLLAYQSAWLRHHYPAEFLCGLLNEQPMGFYPPASLVRDAQRRGVEVRPPDVNRSEARCGLEACGDSPQALSHTVRVGLAYVSSVGKDDAEALEAERAANGPYRDVGDLARRATISRDALDALVRGGACDSFGPRRRDLLWELGLATRPRSVEGTRGEAKQLPLPLDPTAETPVLPDLTRWERMLADYRETGLSVGTHPMTLLRPHLPEGTLVEPRAERGAPRVDGGVRRARRRAAAAGDCERDRVHAPRGRARAGEPHRPEGGLRAAPGDRARRAAPAGPRPLRAGRAEPQRRRLGTREPVRARPARRGDAGGRGGAPARAPLRTSLSGGPGSVA